MSIGGGNNPDEEFTLIRRSWIKTQEVEGRAVTTVGFLELRAARVVELSANRRDARAGGNPEAGGRVGLMVC